jgi:hypothetical protein
MPKRAHPTKPKAKKVEHQEDADTKYVQLPLPASWYKRLEELCAQDGSRLAPKCRSLLAPILNPDYVAP